MIYVNRTERIIAVEQFLKAEVEENAAEALHKFFDDDPEHTFDEFRARAYLMVADFSEMWTSTRVKLYTEISCLSDENLRATLKDIYITLKPLFKNEED